MSTASSDTVAGKSPQPKPPVAGPSNGIRAPSAPSKANDACGSLSTSDHVNIAAALAAGAVALAVRQTDFCLQGPLSAIACPLALFVALVMFVRALAHSALKVLGWAAAISKSSSDDIAVAILLRAKESSITLEVFFALRLTADIDGLDGKLMQWLEVALLVVLCYEVLRTVHSVVTEVTSGIKNMNKGAIVMVTDGAAATIAVLLLCENVGVKLTAIITSLGFGGVVVAMSAQAVLQDLFASVALIMDKPFAQGDYICAKGVMGTVETIGIKTTRLRCSDGSSLVLPNRDLCNTVIENKSDIPFRRNTLQFQVSPDTSSDALEHLEDDLKRALSALSPPYEVYNIWCFVTGFSEWGIDVEMIYNMKGEAPIDSFSFRALNSQLHVILARTLKSRGIELSSSHRLRALGSSRGN